LIFLLSVILWVHNLWLILFFKILLPRKWSRTDTSWRLSLKLTSIVRVFMISRTSLWSTLLLKNIHFSNQQNTSKTLSISSTQLLKVLEIPFLLQPYIPFIGKGLFIQTQNHFKLLQKKCNKKSCTSLSTAINSIFNILFHNFFSLYFFKLIVAETNQNLSWKIVKKSLKQKRNYNFFYFIFLPVSWKCSCREISFLYILLFCAI
jgi:hypothetical protein